ncbi:MAG: hypothetical protein HY738_23585 [Bacteroidia bacterium]|nr:hypothetical protein [Bacteroidia bacterium]
MKKIVFKIAISCLFKLLLFGQSFQPVWEQLDVNVGPGYFTSVYVLNENIAYVAGDNGKLIKTYDAGDTWETLPSGTDADIMDVWFTDENTGYFGCHYYVYKTTNGGYSWSSLSLPIDGYYEKIQFT